MFLLFLDLLLLPVIKQVYDISPSKKVHTRTRNGLGFHYGEYIDEQNRICQMCNEPFVYTFKSCNGLLLQHCKDRV